ncbi:hypothetical protein FRC02_003493, partial [Tulasnella sp. 418]
ELQRVLTRQQRLIKRNKSGVFGGSTSKFKELYNPEGVNGQLDDLRQEIIKNYRPKMIRTSQGIATSVEQISQTNKQL